MAKLILKFREAVIKEFPLDKGVTTIGRALTNDIVIDNMAVSGSHAKVVKEGERFFIEDLNSTNGTFIGDRRIARQPLVNNALITIGKHVLQFDGPMIEDADATMAIRKPLTSEATMMIDTKKLRMEKNEQATSATIVLDGGKRDILGGFTVIDGSTDKPEYELVKRVTTIGKAETAEIKLKGLFAPKIAALVNRTKDGYVINPAGGEKQPVINGKPIAVPYLLKNLDFVEVGNLKLQFYVKED